MRAGPSNETGSSTKATEMTALADAFRDTFAVEYVTAREVMDRRAREVGSRPMVLVDVRGEEERRERHRRSAVSAETYESTRSTLGPHDCVLLHDRIQVGAIRGEDGESGGGRDG